MPYPLFCERASNVPRKATRTILAAPVTALRANKCAAASPKPQRLTNSVRRSALVAQLFDTAVVAAELRGASDAALLYPAEAAFCHGFAAKRIADFTAGRLCARYALGEFGITAFPLLVNADRSPRWPAAMIGSISHTSGFCCAVAAEKATFGSIGVDVEILGRVTPEIEALVFTQREAVYLASLEEPARVRAATILFSAKEAFYKCQHAVTAQWLDFQDASLELTTENFVSGSFSVDTGTQELAFERGVVLPLRGRFCCDGELVLTGLTLRHGTA